MCKKCLITFLVFLAVVIFGFFFIFRGAARGASIGPVINEVAWAGSTNSPNDEWLELYNPSNQSIALDKWKLEATDGSPLITLQGEIPANGYFLLERTDDTSVPNIKANQIYTGSLDNKGEDLKLIDASGMLQDEVNASQGWPAGDNSIKATMSRNDTNPATATWSNGPVNGTPDAQNILISPTPKPSPAPAPLSAQKTSAKTNKATAQIQTQKNTGASATPASTADLAAFNSRVQQTAQKDPPFVGTKDMAGALALLAIGSVSAYTVMRKRKNTSGEL